MCLVTHLGKELTWSRGHVRAGGACYVGLVCRSTGLLPFGGSVGPGGEYFLGLGDSSGRLSAWPATSSLLAHSPTEHGAQHGQSELCGLGDPACGMTWEVSGAACTHHHSQGHTGLLSFQVQPALEGG